MNQLKHKSLAICLVCSIVIIVILLVILVYLRQWKQVRWTSETFEESNNVLSNPYMGWYHIERYHIQPGNHLTFNNTNSDTQLSLIEINLQSYPNGPIDDDGLQQIDSILSNCSAQSKSIILRFLYDWDGNALSTDPDDIAIVKTHMEQVAPSVNQHADQIYTMQGIFVGDYAEMHDSNYLSDEQMKELMNQLNQLISPSIMLSVRTPKQLRLINESDQVLTKDTAYQGTLFSRLGLFNDGIMASDSDYGTYDDHQREQELNFQQQHCDFVPNGGEVVTNNTYNDLFNAIPTMAKMHLSYLDLDYDAEVINKWKDTLYDSTQFNGKDANFNGVTGFDYISAHLGYRYCIQNVALQHSFMKNKMLIDIKNTGFSSSYHQFDVALRAVNNETNTEFTIPINTDTRFWLGNQTTRLEVPISNKLISQQGTYDFYLTVTDPITNRVINFATTYHLGCLQLG